jgi:outer membrane protein OmpA-like peptidoglycan-associated protein
MVVPASIAATVCLLSASVGHADTWVSLEAPAAFPVSGMQDDLFRPGVMPALGAYAAEGFFAVGLRVRAGVLRDGPAPGMNLSDPRMGGLGTFGLAMRLGVRGPWIEAVIGGGITGHDLVPAAEVGAGWSFDLGPVELGPSARFIHVSGPPGAGTLGNAELVLAGLELRFGRTERPAPRHVASAAPRAIAPPEPLVIEADHDDVVDADAGCATDGDGCSVDAEIVVHDDRIVLDDRILFDLAQARVRSRGRELLARVATMWRSHPEWIRMSIEGHADVRGSDEYNDYLSQLRAEHVRAQLVKLGFTVEQMDIVGYGRSRPVDPGTSEAAHARNRRVELVIQRRGAL